VTSSDGATKSVGQELHRVTDRAPDGPTPTPVRTTPPVEAHDAARVEAPGSRADRFLNAQVSVLHFHERVLEEARDDSHPLLERVKFLAISHANLDEFFEVHVSGLRNQREGTLIGTAGLLPDGRTPSEALTMVERVVRPILEAQDECWVDLRRLLSDNGIHVLETQALTPEQRTYTRDYFEREVFPVLTPLAVDPGHPFPHISHLSLNLAVVLDHPEAGERFARLKIPQNLPRLVQLPPVNQDPESPEPTVHPPVSFVWLETLIAEHLDLLFPGVPVRASYAFRVTRDADQAIQEHDSIDLLASVQESLRERAWGVVVRVEAEHEMPVSLRTRLLEELEASDAITDARSAPLGRRDLMALASVDRPDLKYPPVVPRIPPSLAPGEDIFAAIKRRDILLHHPFDSFAPVVQFIEAAAADPDVLAIKQTLYRVGKNSPIVQALVRARQNDKQVAVLVELKARGDEENNIEWAQTLESEGVHVAYGLMGLKTHCKTTLVVRREPDGLRRYVHLATGNYNATTARMYTDIGYFTCRPEIGADMTDLFNTLTGYSRKDQYRALLVSPRSWRRRLVELIDREMSWQARGEPGRIVIKVNGLTDPRIIDLLYRASNAGVSIDLLVRGMCCLRPGVKGLSENIRVTSVLGRFLEHSRIFYFRNGGNEETFLGSADLMPRNLDRRIEVVFPVLDEGWRSYLRDHVLRLYLRDTARARALKPDGTYARLSPKRKGELSVDAQQALLAAARSGA